MNRRSVLVFALPLGCLCAAQSTPVRPGRNAIPVRGVPQAVYYHPGGPGSRDRPCVLFAPGDGGWRGYAITVAEELARWGYDVYGLDTKTYLSGFTGKTTLKESDVAADIRTLAAALAERRRVALLGWSEGAGLMVLAAAIEPHAGYAGLITMGLGDRNVLGWRLVDNLTYLTRKPPNEPSFSVAGYMARIAPLPLVMLQSTNDEYVARDEAARLFHAAVEPKRLVWVEAQNHRFDGAQPEFFRHLRQSLEWMAAPAR